MEKCLCDLHPGQSGCISTLSLCGPMRRRLQDLGFVPGAEVACLYRSCFGDPTAYRLHNTVIALRREDASGIRLQTQ